MTVGVIWEFIEFGADYFLMVDMQKDFVISRLSSVSLDPAGLGRPFMIRNIRRQSSEPRPVKLIPLREAILISGSWIP